MTTRTIPRLILPVLALLAAPVSAQQAARTTFQVNAGAGIGGSTAPHVAKSGLALDALLGFRPGAGAAGAFGLAVSVSGQSFGVNVSCDVVPGGGCTPEFPEFWVVSILAGWETGGGRIRFLVGPAVASSESTRVGAGQARLEVAQPLSGRLDLIASTRFTYIPSYQGDAYRLGAFGVGVRLR